MATSNSACPSFSFLLTSNYPEEGYSGVSLDDGRPDNWNAARALTVSVSVDVMTSLHAFNSVVTGQSHVPVMCPASFSRSSFHGS